MYTLHLDSPVVTILPPMLLPPTYTHTHTPWYNHSAVFKLRKFNIKYCYIIYSWYLDFSNNGLRSIFFSAPGSNVRSLLDIYCHGIISLVSLLSSGTVSQPFFVFHDIAIFKKIGQLLVCRVSIHFSALDCFLKNRFKECIFVATLNKWWSVLRTSQQEACVVRLSRCWQC